MKQYFLIALAIFLSLNLNAQFSRSGGVNTSLNLTINPVGQITTVGNNIGYLAEVGTELSLNNELYFGGAFSQELSTFTSSYGGENYGKYDLSFTLITASIGGYYKLNNSKIQSGRHIKKRDKINYSVRFGGGIATLKNITSPNDNNSDYFYCVEPRLAYNKAINGHFELDFGAGYRMVYSIDKLSEFINNSSIAGPTVHIGFRYNIFALYK